MGFLHHFLVILRGSDDDTGGVEIIVEGMAFPQEFGAEKDVAGVVFLRTDSVKPTGTVDFMMMVASRLIFRTSSMTDSTEEVSK